MDPGCSAREEDGGGRFTGGVTTGDPHTKSDRGVNGPAVLPGRLRFFGFDMPKAQRQGRRASPAILSPPVDVERGRLPLASPFELADCGHDYASNDGQIQ